MPKKRAVDRALFIGIAALVAFGLVMVYSASGIDTQSSDAPVWQVSPLARQLVATAVGVLAMFAAMHLDYHHLKEPWVVYVLLLGVLGLLVAVLFMPMLNNARRWLFLFGFSFQPSELAKLALVVFLAYQIDRKRDRVNTPTFLVPALATLVMLAALILLEPDLGTTVMLVLSGAALLFLGGVAWRYVAVAGLLSVPAVLLLAVIEPRRWQRITTFLDSSADPLGDGWQISQSLIAVGSGGLTGVGLGESVQKMAFLPMANSDFIFAVVCEELGLLGGGALLGLFGLFAWRGFRVGELAPDAFGRFLAWGITMTLTLQALLHMSIALNLLPTTGMTLPFVSSGGTSLLITLAACGVLLNVSQHV